MTLHLKKSPGSFLDHLNPVQREAVVAKEGPVMIVAGAGSGKTRVLTYRAAYLLAEGVRADSILALTFTNKAADEMKSRISSLVGEGSKHFWMGTFHSIFARLLRFECENIGYQRNFTIYDADDSLALVKSIMNSMDIPQQQFSPQGIRARISMAKNQMISPKAYAASAFDPMAERAALVFHEYQKRVKQSNVMDFDDLLLNPIDLFTRHPTILRKYQDRFQYIMVDEYQDTNRAQYRLIQDLAQLHKNICVVGDDAQSIYSFRGADIRNILDFEKDYPQCRVFRLEQNYRSTRTILAAADCLIKNNEAQIAKKLWTENAEGGPVTLLLCDDDRDEGYKIVRKIEDESRRQKLDLKDFAVLYRTNAQSRSLEDALRRNGIPYTIVGGVAFYKRKEIKDVLAYLKVLVNPKDRESLLRIINVPLRSIGDSTVTKLLAYAERSGMPLFDVLGQAAVAESLAPRAARSARAFHDMMKKYMALQSTMSVGEVARSLVDEIGMLKTFKEENTPESLGRRENVQELLSALSEFSDQRPDARLEDFLEEVSLVSDVDTTDFGRNAVTLMTLHAAKGLEFPVVFIAGLEEGLFPLVNSSGDRAELEEERRLCYVGMTRAMNVLYLSCASSRYRFGEQTYSVRSRFIDEIDQKLLLVEGGEVRRQQTPYRRSSGGVASYSPAMQRSKRQREDMFFSDVMPDYENESQEQRLQRVGSRVVHEAFGPGRIIALDGTGDNARAVVDFDSVGRKHLMLKFAHLRSG